jgi:hypothetical protein
MRKNRIVSLLFLLVIASLCEAQTKDLLKEVVVKFESVEVLGDKRMSTRFSRFGREGELSFDCVGQGKGSRYIGKRAESAAVSDCFFEVDQKFLNLLEKREAPITLKVFEDEILATMGDPQVVEMVGEKNLIIKIWSLWNGEREGNGIEVFSVVAGFKTGNEAAPQVVFAAISAAKSPKVRK